MERLRTSVRLHRSDSDFTTTIVIMIYENQAVPFLCTLCGVSIYLCIGMQHMGPMVDMAKAAPAFFVGHGTFEDDVMSRHIMIGTHG
jgi:hypothetical protein